MVELTTCDDGPRAKAQDSAAAGVNEVLLKNPSVGLNTQGTVHTGVYRY